MKTEIMADDKSYKIIVEWKKAIPERWKDIRLMIDNIEKIILSDRASEVGVEPEVIPPIDFYIAELLKAKYDRLQLQEMRSKPDEVNDDLYAPNSTIEEIIKTAKHIIKLREAV